MADSLRRAFSATAGGGGTAGMGAGTGADGMDWDDGAPPSKR